MSTRKPVPEGCDGSVWCPVEGHLRSEPVRSGYRLWHIRLTRGQRLTLHERAMSRATTEASR